MGNGYTTSFHTKKLCSRLYSIEIEFYSKMQKIALWATLWVLGTYGQRTHSIQARWKARGRLPIRHNWTLFRYLLRLRRYKRKSVEVGDFRRWQVNLSANFRRMARRPPTTVGVRKLEWLSFRVVSEYPQWVVWFCHKARVWQTVRRTDRITTPIVESRGINGGTVLQWCDRMLRQSRESYAQLCGGWYTYD